VYVVIGALAAVENVFPPVPADTAVAIGGLLSAGGHVSAWTVLLVTWTGNVGAAALVYAGARTAGRAFFRGPVGARLLNRTALARVEALYGRYGTWAIFVSRFIPGVRAVVAPFAGVANLGAVRALVPVAVASAIWYGAVVYLAATLVRNLPQLRALTAQINRIALLGAAIVAVTVVVLVLWRRRRRSREPQ
jgi:membrane protein DedA with SNARE-associated domain